MKSYFYTGIIGLSLLGLVIFPPADVETTLLFLGLHLLGDLFVILGVKRVLNGDTRGYYFNLIASIIFGTMGLISYLLYSELAYLIPSLIFIPQGLLLIKEKGNLSKNQTGYLTGAAVLLFIYLIQGLELFESLKTFFVLLFALPFLYEGKTRDSLGLIATLGMSIMGISSMIRTYPTINGADLTYGLFPLLIALDFFLSLKKKYSKETINPLIIKT